MKPYRGAIAAFFILGLTLFAVGLFLVGDRHKAFSHHVDFYTDLANVDGLNPGVHVLLNGFDAGQITKVEIPQRPTGKFRLKLHVGSKLKHLIRTDSVVTVETDGLVGDKFLLIHSGSDGAQPISDGGTILGKEPIEFSAILQKVSGTIDQANTTITDVLPVLMALLTPSPRPSTTQMELSPASAKGTGPWVPCSMTRR